MVSIEVRKLISFGKGSYIISMPKSWVKRNNLKKGDLISINEEGIELSLSASQQEKKAEPKEIDINSKNKNLELLKAEIVSSYLNGYDTINILFDDRGSRDAPKIKDVIRNLSGLEIMEQTSTRLVAKNLINVNEISIKNIIRRMDIITRAMIEDAILCYRGHSTYDSLYNRDSDINRLYFLGYKVVKNMMKDTRFAKLLATDPWRLHSDMLVILRLEKIADRQKRIARYLCRYGLDRTTLAELDKVHTDISEAYNLVMKSYYNEDKQIAFQVEISNKDRIELCNKFLERHMHNLKSKGKNTNQNMAIIAQIVENLKATTESVKNIARTVLCYE